MGKPKQSEARQCKPQQRKANDLSRCLVALDGDHTLIAVVELSLSSWLIAGVVPGVERQPLKKLKAEPAALLEILHRWRLEAERSGRKITRIAVAYEAGRDGFWLARWLMARGLEPHVIHPASVAVSREHRRAKTDRLDTDLLKRAFVGWLRGERDHCKMVAIPTLQEEDAKRPNRERECLVAEQSRLINRMKSTLVRLGIRSFNPKLKRAVERLETLRTPEGGTIPSNTLAELKRDMERRSFICEQIRKIEEKRIERLKQAPNTGPNVMVRLLARVVGIGIDTADLLVHEMLLRPMRDRRAVGRYGGLTGSPERSGSMSREKGLARSGNARVRRTMVQLAWRFLRFQKNSALAEWYCRRTANAPKARKTMIVALARKLLIALWRLVREGVVPEGVVMRPT
jgi:transposase